ncbi:MAG: hypothetical protein DI570_09345 [Phenylobacterium zucineum]|nr:MAG: hypothetical protein DI570_09345 [Phenylobacterium zucineum]
MSIDHPPLPPAPAGIVQGMAKLEGLAALLACVDPQKWDSLGRPAALSIAAIVGGAHASLEADLAEHFKLPSPD